ncbi:hypothetical protein J608_4939, partial [Acinetobacter baumannii 1288284]
MNLIRAINRTKPIKTQLEISVNNCLIVLRLTMS